MSFRVSIRSICSSSLCKLYDNLAWPHVFPLTRYNVAFETWYFRRLSFVEQLAY